MSTNNIPILEFDPTPEAIIEPSKVIQPLDIPERCVLCFFQDILAAHLQAGHLYQTHQLHSEFGYNPIYLMTHEGQTLVVAHPGVGGPLAAAFLEELIALGCRQFIACGSCGVLDVEITLGQVVVPETAVRDEGTSYHYLPPSREVAASPAAVAAINQVLNQHHVPHITGKTWTTDAIYRETRAKLAQRRAEGCLTVEMEAASFFAVAQFRGVTFGQLLYGGDNLGGDEWDHRDYIRQGDTREKLFWLAVAACLAL
jgi:uridine phosphorylase